MFLSKQDLINYYNSALYEIVQQKNKWQKNFGIS